ncbi:MAG: hypothetical protein ACUVUQ_02310 [Thermodesulfovibrionales bacterium]
MLKGQGSGRGMGRGMGKGMGRGRMGGTRPGEGQGGYCVCINCGERVEHQQGVPCYSVKCPKCGTMMMRE